MFSPTEWSADLWPSVLILCTILNYNLTPWERMKASWQTLLLLHYYYICTGDVHGEISDAQGRSASGSARRCWRKHSDDAAKGQKLGSVSAVMLELHVTQRRSPALRRERPLYKHQLSVTRSSVPPPSRDELKRRSTSLQLRGPAPRGHHFFKY